ncbi:MAG: D-glycero-beta-D-manno-heptose-7-phosphate kinase, partial [Alphaproteobacteria bacterium]
MQQINSDTLAQLIANIEKSPVLVIGDIMLDRFVYGQVDRISPESPVPVLSITREDKMLGGAGNALGSLKGLKTDAYIISVIGADQQGDLIKREVESLGSESCYLVQDKNRPTTIKTRYLAGHQQLLRSDFENKTPISADVEKQVLDHAQSLMPKMKAVLVSDYGKGLLTPSLLAEIMQLAKAQDIRVIVDPKGNDYSIYEGAYAVTPNKKELAEATGNMPVSSDKDIVAASQSLIEKAGISCVVATRSAEGMSIIEKAKANDPLHLRTTAKEVFDVSGAGDVVIATIAAGLASGADISHAAALANIAGGIAVSKVGTAPIRQKELLDVLADEQVTKMASTPVMGVHATDRILQAPLADFDEALEQVRRWRARGLKIGFTNGCFDILHFGHVSYLNQARAHCDRLIIGLNTDLSVKALKGNDRPVHDEQSRAAVLGALGAVDMVVLFGGQNKEDDQTANALILRLEPDIYFKGGDYKKDDIPETPMVERYGGAVKILSVFEGHSTTGSIKKINAA